MRVGPTGAKGARIASLLPAGLLSAAIMFATTGCSACPTALLVGVLSEENGELVVVPEAGGPVTHVKWPDWTSIERRDGALVVTEFFGGVKARAGDAVRLGGGSSAAGRFGVCGQFDVEPASPSSFTHPPASAVRPVSPCHRSMTTLQ